MNMYDPTHSLQCEFFSCKTENIRRAAAALVVIVSSAQYLTGSVLWKHKQENSCRVALGIILTPQMRNNVLWGCVRLDIL